MIFVKLWKSRSVTEKIAAALPGWPPLPFYPVGEGCTGDEAGAKTPRRPGLLLSLTRREELDLFTRLEDLNSIALRRVPQARLPSPRALLTYFGLRDAAHNYTDDGHCVTDVMQACARL